MRVERQPAFVLHERPYRETSLLLEAFTRDHGRVGLVARGARAARPRFGRGVLAPLVPLEIGWTGRGELPTLTAAEPVAAPFALAGDALLPALYLNELLTRLLARHDAHPELFARYTACLGELSAGGDLGWILRCFERDALTLLGYGLELEHDGVAGAVLEPGATYGYDPERGAVPWEARPVAPSIRGASLLALARGTCPDAASLRELRRLMRAVLRHHLGGRDLHSWSMSRTSD
jgi:DNA repair protein RecO (recombination protein O)